MKPSETSAAVGYNLWHSIDDLPFSEREKEAILEWLARRLWILLEESTGDPEYYCKSYDPLVIELTEAYSYVFDLEDGGRHHAFESLEHLERMLMDEAITTLLYRHKGTLTCMTCGRKYADLREAHYERHYWWCKDCTAISGGKLVEFPTCGKLIPESILTEADERW